MLIIDNLSKSFTHVSTNEAVPVLKDINFSANEGQFVCIVGPSGCGKTTLLRIIAGLEKQDSGHIYLNQREITVPVTDIGFIFQETTLLPWRTVVKNVEFGLEIAKVPRAERRKKALDLIELVELKGFEDYYPKQISGGMKRKAALAMSLIVEPKILLMDEPFVALDCQARSQLQEALLNIWEKTKKTIIFVTHNVEEAVFLADEIVCLSTRPAEVHQVIRVDMPRPRDRTSPELNKIRKEILSFIKTVSFLNLPLLKMM